MHTEIEKRGRDYLVDPGERLRTLKGMIAGAVGGLAASWVMNQFQAVITNLQQSQSDQGESKPQSSSGEDATVKTASAISENVAGHHLTEDEKKAAGALVHYAFGTAMGALYGVAAELNSKSATGWGIPFGTAVWLGADEVAVPALGLSGAPADAPISTHASALAAHVVYGLTTETVRRTIRRALA